MKIVDYTVFNLVKGMMRETTKDIRESDKNNSKSIALTYVFQ